MVDRGSAVAHGEPVAAGRPPARPHRAGLVTSVALWASVLTLGASAGASADPPAAVPQQAGVEDLKWQPATDYDGDGCYPVPAISSEGAPAAGLRVGGGLAQDCSDASDLANTNSYVRTWCQGGWCAHKYAYYFEKDQKTAVLAEPAGGHRHDWEHVVVWVQDGVLRFVAVSGHGGYSVRRAADVELSHGTHPEVVYSKDGADTHRFRHADPGDEPPENETRTWQLPALVAWERMDPGVRDVLATHDFDEATLALTDSEYSDDLWRSLTGEQRQEVGFDFAGPDPSTEVAGQADTREGSLGRSGGSRR